MNQLNRRELLQSAGLLLATPQARAAPLPAAATGPGYEWIRSTRLLIAEAYNPPFYPSLDYKPEKAVRIAQELNADSLRYPAASYYAYFPTQSGYPVHQELWGRSNATNGGSVSQNRSEDHRLHAAQPSLHGGPIKGPSICRLEQEVCRRPADDH